ncbi:MAG: DUF371 domain-containing protein [Candidatus Korarchaeota archaeon]|nr:DUF371 domain-containing protein [Candidatus Korarchaeota archaeon]
MRFHSDAAFAVRARGHPNVRARHRTTMEVTRDDYLTERGDCILAIEADAACSDVSGWLREHLRSGGWVLIELEVEGEEDRAAFSFRARGDPRLTLASDRSIVIRRSSYVDDRTMAVLAEAAAADVPRGMVRALRAGARLTLTVRPLAGDASVEEIHRNP